MSERILFNGIGTWFMKEIFPLKESFKTERENR